MSAKNAKKWRNDFRPTVIPTIGNVVVTAVDDIKTERDYSLVIKHVLSFPDQKGFMCNIHSASEISKSVATGLTFIGEDQTAYNEALTEGRELFKARMDLLDQLARM